MQWQIKVHWSIESPADLRYCLHTKLAQRIGKEYESADLNTRYTTGKTANSIDERLIYEQLAHFVEHVFDLSEVRGCVKHKVHHNHLPFHLACTHAHTHSFISWPPLTLWAHLGGISRFHFWPREKQSPAVSSVSHYLQSVRQSECSQRRIPVFSLKSSPDYSKLLACLQHSSRPLGHPLAVPEVGAITCHHTSWVFLKETVMSHSIVIRVCLPSLWEGAACEWLYEGL